MTDDFTYPAEPVDTPTDQRAYAAFQLWVACYKRAQSKDAYTRLQWHEEVRDKLSAFMALEVPHE